MDLEHGVNWIQKLLLGGFLKYNEESHWEAIQAKSMISLHLRNCLLDLFFELPFKPICTLGVRRSQRKLIPYLYTTNIAAASKGQYHGEVN